MLMLERRLQIMIDDARYRRLAAAADGRGVSVARVVRDAIDEALPDDIEGKRAAWEALLAAEPIPVPATIEELNAELDELHSGGL